MRLANQMLDSVEAWAFPDYWLIRETAAGAPPGTRGAPRRLDGLLVPCSFEASVLKRPGYWTSKLAVVGVEIKASRADFLNGLRRNQFSDYAEHLAGLFVVTGRDVKSAEVPVECGHLVCFDAQANGKGIDGTYSTDRIVCRRKPKWRDAELDADTAWRIVFHAAAQARDVRNEMRNKQQDVDRVIGEKFARSLRQLAAGR